MTALYCVGCHTEEGHEADQEADQEVDHEDEAVLAQLQIQALK